MANTSRMQVGYDGAEADGGFPPLSLGLSHSQPSSDLRPASLALPTTATATVTAATLGLSVPSLPQSYASDDPCVLNKPPSPQPQHAEHAAGAPADSELRTTSDDTDRQQQAAAEQKEEEQPTDDSDDEPAWETVHADDTAALDDDDDTGEKLGSSTVEDSLSAMQLSLFDDATQLPDDIDLLPPHTTAPHPTTTTASQHNLVSSLPAFPSLPSGLRTPPPVVPATPSPPLGERLSPATGSGSGRAGVVGGLLSPRSPDVVLSSIGAPSPPPSPQPALPATEPVSSSSSSSSASSASSAAASVPPILPPELVRRPSTYSQETNPILSLQSTPSSPSPVPSLPPQPYSQHLSMPALEQATADQPDMDVEGLLQSGERQSSVEAVRDEDGFVRPALPRRQTTQERRNGSQQASQAVLSPPHSPPRSSVLSPHSSSSSSSPPSAATAAPPGTPPRAAAASSVSMQRSASQLLASQMQSQVESQAWDLAYHYPELDAAAREQLIVDRGLTAVYGQRRSSVTNATDREESRVDAEEEAEAEAEEEEQLEAVDEDQAADATDSTAVQAQQGMQQSQEFDIDIDLSDHEDADNDATEQPPAAQPADQSALSHPIPDATFCDDDSDDIPQFTISHSFTASNGSPPAEQYATAAPLAAVVSPEFSLAWSPSDSPLSPPPPAVTPTKQVNGTATNHVASRTRSRELQQSEAHTPPLPPPPPPPSQRAAAIDHRPERNGQEAEKRQTEQAQNGSNGQSLERQLSIDPEHPGSDTVLQQRQLMRDIRKQQRREERFNNKPTAAATKTATTHKTPTRTDRQPSEGRQTRTRARQGVAVREKDRSGSEEKAKENEEEEDDDFVPLSNRLRPYSATREHQRRTADKSERRSAHVSRERSSRSDGGEREARLVPTNSNTKRKVILDDDEIEEAQEDDNDKENDQPPTKQWKRLHKPHKDDDSSSAQSTPFSAKKVKASDRANKLRQSSLLEHYSSTPTLTPPIAVEEPLDFTPDPASLPPPALFTPAPAAYSTRRVAGKAAVACAPSTAPSLFASTSSRNTSPSSSSASSSSTSLTSPCRPVPTPALAPAATISIASRRGLVDITNTVNSRQRPLTAKQPSNGWRTKRRKGDDGTEWEESPPSKRVPDAGRPQRSSGEAGAGGGGGGGGLRRSAANVASLGRRGGRERRVEREVVVLDATQDQDG